MPKYRALRELLLAEGVVSVSPSEVAPREWLETAHDPSYISKCLALDLSPDEVRRLGMPLTDALVARARAAVYGTVQAAHAALEDGIAGNLAGGTHHAFYDRGEGYCLFNDVAIALKQLPVRRPFIVDLDVHQGNGTAAMFANDPNVFTFSMHARTNYPLRKERSSLDVELEDGTDDVSYLSKLEETLPRALEAHQPDFIFYQSGVDALKQDRLGRLALTHEGMRERDRRVLAWSKGLPICVTLGGGYGRPLEATVEAHAGTFREAAVSKMGKVLP